MSALGRLEEVEVAVVGGGPVGLAVGCLLAKAGAEVAVLERRTAPSGHSRSIGIHPPALEALEPTGVVPELLERGMRVERGHAYAGRRRLGTLSFATCLPPYRYVLTVPQPDSERVLEAQLRSLAPAALRRGVEVTGLVAGAEAVTLTLSGSRSLRASLVVACDGHGSRLRRALDVPVRVRGHPDRFLMGDFPDASGLGRDAAIYLTPAGVVEAFPLPGGKRRWVAAVEPRAPLPGGALDRPAAAARLSALVWRRVGVRLDADACDMISAFGVRTVLSRRLVAGRVAFAGDAAHAIPPFGGQGMNLGWLDAAALAATVARVRGGEHLGRVPPWQLQRALASYERERLGAAAAAASRAEFNLTVGRGGASHVPRTALVWLGLRTPAARAFARRFTMRGLEAGVPRTAVAPLSGWHDASVEAFASAAAARAWSARREERRDRAGGAELGARR